MPQMFCLGAKSLYDTHKPECGQSAMNQTRETDSLMSNSLKAPYSHYWVWLWLSSRGMCRISSDFESGSLTRTTRPQYPWNSLREGLVNAFAHRDYASFSGGVTTSVYPNRIEIRNSGRLPKGISAESLRRETHDSILVNPDISHVFYLYELMERVGRGTFKIVQECREYGMRLPEWKSGASGVRLTFFAVDLHGAQSLELNERQEKLLRHLSQGNTITRQEYVARFAMGVTDRTARRDLSELEDHRLLDRHGSGPEDSLRTERGETMKRTSGHIRTCPDATSCKAVDFQNRGNLCIHRVLRDYRPSLSTLRIGGPDISGHWEAGSGRQDLPEREDKAMSRIADVVKLKSGYANFVELKSAFGAGPEECGPDGQPFHQSSTIVTNY